MIIKDKQAKIGIVVEDEKILTIMATTSINPKQEPKSRRRLARIKRNLFRELAALNKEVIRHRGVYD